MHLLFSQCWDLAILLWQQEQLEQVQRSSLGDGAQTKLLKQRLAELQKEIERFRHENVMLEKLRKEREEVSIGDLGNT